jgi:hypothetical protein
VIKTTCDSGPAGPTLPLPGSSSLGELHCIRPRPERPTQSLDQYAAIADDLPALRAFVHSGISVPGPHDPSRGCASPPGLFRSQALRCLFAMACFVGVSSVHGQDTATSPKLVEPITAYPKPFEPKPASIELFQREASEYEITLKNGRPATLNATPVFKWANDVKNNQDGALFVWMQDDRPQVLGCVFTYYYQGQERRKHQFHSLATEGLSAAVDGVQVWQPASSGLTFTILPTAGNPETDPAKLKLQLRRLSRRFSAELEEEKGGSSELRLIPTPLLTYSPKKSDCLAGGVFVFATGTDPDLVLVLEARNTNDQLAWNYAFARFHYGRLTGKLDEAQVWQAPGEWAMKTDRRENSAFRESHYVSFRTK